MEPQHQFDELRKLLRWKKHEQPPPGFFDSFSARVLDQLQVAESKNPAITLTWWEWVLSRCDAKPALACAYGMALSGLLLIGFSSAQLFDTSQQPVDGQWIGAGPLPETPFPSNSQAALVTNQPGFFPPAPAGSVQPSPAALLLGAPAFEAYSPQL